MTPERAREEGRARGRIGMSDRIPMEMVVEMSDECIEAFLDGHAEGIAIQKVDEIGEAA